MLTVLTPARAAQRRALRRRLPARPGLHRRRRHPGLADAGRRSARCRCSRCSPRCPTTAPTPGWTPWLIAVPPLVAASAAARAQRRHPTLRWEEGALRGCAGGVLAGVLLGALAAVAGGAVGPGRMRDVGPLAFDVLVHAITAFGIGGLLGGLAMTWWQRRRRPTCGAAGPPRLRAPCPPHRPRAPRRARLRLRHQPPGAARRVRRPGVRRPGGRGRRRPRRHRGPGPRRAGRDPDVRAPGQGLRRPARTGTRALADAVAGVRARPRRARRAS